MNTNRNSELLYPDLSYKIVGVCFDTHNKLGQYAREKQYGDKIESLLKQKDITFEREMTIGSSGNRVDFCVENKIIIELKACRQVTGKDYHQLQRYLQEAWIDLGLLVNFRRMYLKPKRVVRIEKDS